MNFIINKIFFFMYYTQIFLKVYFTFKITKQIVSRLVYLNGNM